MTFWLEKTETIHIYLTQAMGKIWYGIMRKER